MRVCTPIQSQKRADNRNVLDIIHSYTGLSLSAPVFRAGRQLDGFDHASNRPINLTGKFNNRNIWVSGFQQ